MKLTRRLLQLAFLVLTLVGVYVFQGHAERWCPFGGVEAIYTYVNDGNLTCSLGVSNFYILGAVLLITLLLRRAFCSYACPIGTISEWLSQIARKLGIRQLRVPPTLDRVLGLLKYPVLAIILYITWRAGELLFRGFDPCYALISRHGTDITFWAYVVAGAIVLASLIVVLPFCRWLCPLAAVMSPFSAIGLARVRRHADACVDCGLCTRVCPMGIAVDKARDVTAARCTACLECVAACPKTRDGAMSWGPPKWLGGRWSQAVLVVVLLACLGGAVAATYVCPLPSFMQAHGEAPARVAACSLRVKGVSCRHSSIQFVEWVTRTGDGVPGYVKVEAWPGPEFAPVRITYDPTITSESQIKRAIVSPTIDLLDGTVTYSTYEIEGYTPSVDDL